MDSINLDIYKGDTIGFIGDSGSGKSTLVDLIIGLLKPIAGKILVDGKPINTKSSNWLNHFGYVQQNIYLIDDSLKMNIAFGELDHDIDTSLLTNAIKNSELDELVNALPNGLDTNVGERGVKLSGGQKQRIAIARALYRNPEILIFDEATSALDTNTEDKVMLSINKLKENHTLIIVAHRHSTLKDCDIVYKLVNGKLEVVKNFNKKIIHFMDQCIQ